MDSTDDGFHSLAHDLTGEEEVTRKSLQSRERELKAICDNLGLNIPCLGKITREKLEKYSKNLSEKEITEVSRAHIMECHARQVLKQDELKALQFNLYHQHISTAHLVKATHDMNTLHKKSIRSLRNEKEKNEKNLEKIQPFFSRPESHTDHRLEIDGRTELMRRAALVAKILSEKKGKQQEPSKIPIVVGDNVLAELPEKTKELEALNNRLAEIGLQ